MAEITENNTELNDRIQALPLELQDIILWFTDAFQIPDTPVSITEFSPVFTDRYQNIPTYAPPIAFQLNRKLRAQFATKYYSTVTFELVTKDHADLLTPRPFRKPAMHYLSRWLKSLSKSHLDLIKSLQFTEWDGVRGYYQNYQEKCIVDAKCFKALLTRLGMENIERVKLVLACKVSRDREIMELERFSVQDEQLFE
ncbi:uncharacterized protein RCC_06919 [Ramularia collo-cygni]|uniref:Uncharacterized protein n=1 Tax=Ramularia collo-cygni TaxID=112498 RepID=A0A2D3UZW3_9PEZI|nr:uncharacterized protein RCC_06919 [Ramularia collo-cygni]CZT21058.1 uncharacterized protein RCC_06919 [Ramularia collo-cygni]